MKAYIVHRAGVTFLQNLTKIVHLDNDQVLYLGDSDISTMLSRTAEVIIIAVGTDLPDAALQSLSPDPTVSMSDQNLKTVRILKPIGTSTSSYMLIKFVSPCCAEESA